MMSSLKNISHEDILYNNIRLLSRNKFFYTKINLSDTFQNRIHLIFMHLSFLFIKVKQTPSQEIEDPISFFLNFNLEFIYKSIPLFLDINFTTLPV